MKYFFFLLYLFPTVLCGQTTSSVSYVGANKYRGCASLISIKKCPSFLSDGTCFRSLILNKDRDKDVFEKIKKGKYQLLQDDSIFLSLGMELFFLKNYAQYTGCKKIESFLLDEYGQLFNPFEGYKNNLKILKSSKRLHSFDLEEVNILTFLVDVNYLNSSLLYESIGVDSDQSSVLVCVPISNKKVFLKIESFLKACECNRN